MYISVVSLKVSSTVSSFLLWWCEKTKCLWDEVEYTGTCDTVSDYWHSDNTSGRTSTSNLSWLRVLKPWKATMDEEELLYFASTNGCDLPHTHQWSPKASRCTSSPSLPSALLKSAGIRSPQRGCNMSTHCWWLGVPVFLDPMGLKQLKTVLGRLSHPRTRPCTGSRNTLPVFLWKRPIYLSYSFSLRGWHQVYHTSRGYWNALSEWGLGDTILALSLGLATAHQYLLERSS